MPRSSKELALLNLKLKRFELVCLLAVALVGTLIFWKSPVDLIYAHFFYFPDSPNGPWPVGLQPFWLFLYKVVPFLTAGIIAAAFGLLFYDIRFKKNRLSIRYGLFILLTTLIGPGLLVNSLFKDNWQRPRPREIVEFGGQEKYVEPFIRGTKGKSFPSGHTSIGFTFVLGYFYYRLRRVRLAFLCLFACLVFGAILGVARMAAGAHFVSDIVWSALMTIGTAFVLYHFVLKIPRLEILLLDSVPQSPSASQSKLANPSA